MIQLLLVVLAPLIALAEPPSVRDLFSNPALQSPRLSPDGKRIAFLLSQGDVQAVASRALAGGKATVHGKLESPETRFAWLAWAKPDVLWIAAATEGPDWVRFRFHRGQVLAVSTATGEIKSFGWSPQVQHWLPDDPKRVLVNWRGGVATIDAATGKRIGMPVERASDFRFDWHADASAVFRAREEYGETRYAVQLRREAEGAFETAFLWDRRGAWGPEFLGFHDDPGKFYVHAPHEGRRAVFVYDLATKQLDLVASDPAHDVRALVLDPSTRRTLGVTWVADSPQKRFFDAEVEADREDLQRALAERFGRHVAIDFVSWDRSHQIALVEVSSDIAAPRYFVFNRARGSIMQLLEERPSLTGKSLAPMRRIEIVARDGLQLPAYLTLPPGAEPKALPLVLIAHGGPSARDSIVWNPEVQLFATRGFAVLQVNFRGSEGFGDAFWQAGFREWGGKMQDDLTDAVRQLVREGVVDADRVGIYGASYGGYAALTGLVATPELYRAGAAYASVTDIRTLLHDETKWAGHLMRHLMREQVGGGWDDRDRVRMASPELRAAEVRVPVLLGHGEADGVVPVTHSREMAAALRNAGKSFEYLEFPHEIHGFLLEANRIRWYEALIAFFERNLAPRTNAAPSAGAPAATALAEPKP